MGLLHSNPCACFQYYKNHKYNLYKCVPNNNSYNSYLIAQTNSCLEIYILTNHINKYCQQIHGGPCLRQWSSPWMTPGVPPQNPAPPTPWARPLASPSTHLSVIWTSLTRYSTETNTFPTTSTTTLQVRYYLHVRRVTMSCGEFTLFLVSLLDFMLHKCLVFVLSTFISVTC